MTSSGRRDNNGSSVPFRVGDVVVHPRHGAGSIVRRYRDATLGEPRWYLEIEIGLSALRLRVPCDTARAVGLRPVIDRDGARRITRVLGSAPTCVSGHWPARKRRYDEMLAGGDVYDLATLVRDLAARACTSRLSVTERELLDRSQRVLASELGYVLELDSDRAADFIDKRVRRSEPRA